MSDSERAVGWKRQRSAAAEEALLEEELLRLIALAYARASLCGLSLSQNGNRHQTVTPRNKTDSIKCDMLLCT